jgi:predicted nucleic acid-binding protein
MPLLDTDIMVDVLRQYPPAISWLTSLGDEPVILPGYVAMELYQGCKDGAEQAKVDRVLKTCKIAWPSEESCMAALAIFKQQHLGSGLGVLDTLIGQTAVALNMPLHTFNQKHYRAILGLELVQPYERVG